MKTLTLTLGAIFLLPLFLNCGGGSSEPPAPPLLNATKLSYTEPSTTSWRFVRVSGSGSTTDPMIFELRGPSGAPVKGASFYIDLGSSPKVHWHNLNGASYFDFSTNSNMGFASESGARLLKDKINNYELQVGAFRKNGSADPSGGVIRLALKLASTSQWPGDVSVTVSKTTILDANGNVSTPSITFGSLKAE